MDPLSVASLALVQNVGDVARFIATELLFYYIHLEYLEETFTKKKLQA